MGSPVLSDRRGEWPPLNHHRTHELYPHSATLPITATYNWSHRFSAQLLTLCTPSLSFSSLLKCSVKLKIVFIYMLNSYISIGTIYLNWTTNILTTQKQCLYLVRQSPPHLCSTSGHKHWLTTQIGHTQHTL